jgi:peptidoglycan-associated lipoprotein
MIVNRVLVSLLIVVLAVAFAACGGSKAVDEPPADITEAPVVEDPVEEPKPPVVVEPKEIPMPELGDVYYAFDKYELTSESKRALESNSSELKRATDVTIIIEGHCDERGTKSYNLALGEKRAKAARDYLVSLGVSSSRLTVVSYGKERPFDPGHNEAAWAKNRRAHFVVKK